MHVLAANSVATLLNYLEEQLQHTPTPAQIQGTQKEDEVDEEKPEGEGVEQKVWLVNWDHSIGRQVWRRVRVSSSGHARCLKSTSTSTASAHGSELLRNFNLSNTPYSKMAAILVFFCFHANWPLWPCSRLNILLNFTFESEAMRAICIETKEY